MARKKTDEGKVLEEFGYTDDPEAVEKPGLTEDIFRNATDLAPKNESSCGVPKLHPYL